MTNKILNSLVFLIVISMNGFSQHPPAIAENAIWITRYQIGSPPNTSYTLYKTSGDTIIQSKNYIKIYKEAVYQTGSYTYNQTGPLMYGFAYRNDTSRRAYIVPSGSITEELWYDFNLATGDTLPINQPWYSTGFLSPADTIIVTGIDSVLYCNQYFKRYNFNKPMFPSLVQSVGFTGDLVNMNYDYFESYVDLRFFSPDTNMINCQVIITSDNELPEMGPNILSIYPNPASEKIYADCSNLDFIPDRIRIIDLNGKSIINLRGTFTEKIIPVSFNLPDGMYLLQLQNNNRTMARLFQVNHK